MADGQFVIDGPVLVAEAVDAGIELSTAFVDAAEAGSLNGLVDRLVAAGTEVRHLGPGVLARAVETVTPHGIAAVARRPDPAALAPAGRPTVPPLVPVLVGVADPGNAGTLARTAEASGATALWASAGTVDLYSPKVVRASAGSLFRVPVLDGLEPGPALEALRASGATVLATVPRGGVAPEDVDLTGPIALLLGNEAHGLGGAWCDAVDRSLTIPMAGRAESLNVAMAGTLVCFEAARQRRRRE